MISVTTELAALLESGSLFYMVDLFTVTLCGGTVLRYTSADVDVTVDAHTFSSSLPIKRDSINVSVGLEVDTLELTVYPQVSDLIGSIPWAAAVRLGALDGAKVQIDRAFFTAATPPVYVGKILRFLGCVADISDFSGSAIPITVKSYLMLLDTMMPRNIYQPTCRRTLFGIGCGLTKASYSRAITALTSSTKTDIRVTITDKPGGSSGTLNNVAMGTADGDSLTFSATLEYAPKGISQVYFNGGTDLWVHVGGGTLGGSDDELRTTGYTTTIQGATVSIEFELHPDKGTVITADFPYTISGYYDLGTCTCTAGANLGLSRTVKQFYPARTPVMDPADSVAHLVFALPWAKDIAAGDTFNLYPGCDKLQSTCDTKFSNLAKFSAEPYTPVPETAY